MRKRDEELLTKLVAKLATLPMESDKRATIAKVAHAKQIILANIGLSIKQQAELAGQSMPEITYARWQLRKEGKLGKYTRQGMLIIDAKPTR